MSSNYIYNKTDFTSIVNNISLTNLKKYISDSQDVYTNLETILCSHDNDVSIYNFVFSDELSQEEQDALDSLVAAYSNLQEYREQAFTKIDDAAGRARSRYVTTSPGQDAVYTLKAADAESYKSKGYPHDTTKYKFIEAEMAATGMSAKDVADMLIQIKSQWILLAAGIEQVRLSGKNLIKTKTTKEEIDAITSQTISVLDGI